MSLRELWIEKFGEFEKEGTSERIALSLSELKAKTGSSRPDTVPDWLGGTLLTPKHGSFYMVVSDEPEETDELLPLLIARYEAWLSERAHRAWTPRVHLFKGTEKDLSCLALKKLVDKTYCFEQLGSWIRNRIKEFQVLEEARRPFPVLVILYGLSDRQLFGQTEVKQFAEKLEELDCFLVVTSSFQLEIPWETRARVTGLACRGVENNKILSHLWTQFGTVACGNGEFARLVSRPHKWTWIDAKRKRSVGPPKRPACYQRLSGLYDLDLSGALSEPEVPKVLFSFGKECPVDRRLLFVHSCLQWHFEQCECDRDPVLEAPEQEAKTSTRTCLFVPFKGDRALARKALDDHARTLLHEMLTLLLTEEEMAHFQMLSSGSWLEGMDCYEYPSWADCLSGQA